MEMDYGPSSGAVTSWAPGRLSTYFGFDKDTQFVKVDFCKEDKEIRELLKENKLILDMSNPFGIYYMSQHRIIRKYLTKEEFAFLYKKSIKALKTHKK